MGEARWSSVLHYLQKAAGPAGLGELTDDQLLEHFIRARDEAAFAALVRRHGPLVLGVCRRVLHHEADAEDAFQATFLVLARKAASIVRREAVASWLYGVAVRIARKAATGAARRRRREQPLQDLPAPDASHRNRFDLRAVLDDEVNRLPRLYRTPFVLCYVQGLTFAEAARQLGCPRGTVATRLARARERLRARLTGRGVTLSTGIVAALFSSQATAGVPLALVNVTVRGAVAFVTGRAVVGAASLSAVALAKGALQTMLLTKIRWALAGMLVVGLAGSGTGVLTYQTWAAGRADAPDDGPGKLQQGNESPWDALRNENERLKKELQELKARTALLQNEMENLKQQIASQIYGDAARRTQAVQPQTHDHAKAPPAPPRAPTVVDTQSVFKGHTGAVLAVAFSPDGKMVASGGADQVVKIQASATGKEIDSLQGPAERVTTVAFSPDGRLLAAGTGDQMALVWDVATGRLIRSLRANASAVDSLAFSPDGRSLLSAGADRVNLWDVSTGKLLWRMGDAGNKGTRVVFSPDGKIVFCGGSDSGMIRLLDAATGKEIRRLAGQGSAIRAMAVAPSGRLLATGGADNSVSLWDVAHAHLFRRFQAHDGAVVAVAFSPDGRLLITGGLDKTVMVWDVATGGRLSTWKGTAGEITAIAVAPNGHWVAVGSTDNTVRLWRLSI